MGFDLNKAAETLQDQEGLPPVDKWNPDYCGEIDMRILRDGRWLYMGTPINRPAMVKLFARVLWLEEGRYYLKTPVEKVGIEVEDAPFLITAVVQEEDRLVFATSYGDQITAGKDHPIWVEECPETGEPSPYIKVRFNMPGLISRNVFYQLVEMAQEEEVAGKPNLVLHSAGETFTLGSL